MKDKIEYLLKDKMKIKEELFNVKAKKVRIIFAKDGSILDTSQLTDISVLKMVKRVTELVTEWGISSELPCILKMKLYHSDTKKNFLDIILKCTFSITERGDGTSLVVNSQSFVYTNESINNISNSKYYEFSYPYRKILKYLLFNGMIDSTKIYIGKVDDLT